MISHHFCRICRTSFGCETTASRIGYCRDCAREKYLEAADRAEREEMRNRTRGWNTSPKYRKAIKDSKWWYVIIQDYNSGRGYYNGPTYATYE